MFNQLMIAKDFAKSFIQDKKGAVAFEYVLIIGGVSVVVIGLLTAGANAKTTFSNGVAVFQLTEKGLMASVDIAGTKYWKSDKLN